MKLNAATALIELEFFVADCPNNSFDLLGEPDVLSDAFFDALARLLLDLDDKTELRQRSEEEAS